MATKRSLDGERSKKSEVSASTPTVQATVALHHDRMGEALRASPRLDELIAIAKGLAMPTGYLNDGQMQVLVNTARDLVARACGLDDVANLDVFTVEQLRALVELERQRDAIFAADTAN